jgi:hypothetical protein
MGAILRVGPDKLWLPGQIKPGGVPKINWSHPLAANLISYWFDTGQGFYLDLVTKEISVLGGVSFPPIDASPYGTGFKYISSLRQGMQEPNNFPIQSWVAPFSWAAGFLQLNAPSLTTAPTYFGLADAIGDTPLSFYYSNGGVTLRAYAGNQAGAGLSMGSAPVNGTFNVAVAAALDSTTKAAWLNGISQGTETGVSTSYSGANLKTLVNQFRTGSGTSEQVGAQVFFGAIWSRSLSAQEALQLYLDPYCFLMPADMPVVAGLSQAAAAQLMGQIWLA